MGRKKSNSFGLHDVHGNALEWCQDRFAADYYADSPPSDPSGAKEGSPRVVRGGSWNSLAGDCRSAYRYGGEPWRRFNGLGFRVVRSPSGK